MRRGGGFGGRPENLCLTPSAAYADPVSAAEMAEALVASLLARSCRIAVDARYNTLSRTGGGERRAAAGAGSVRPTAHAHHLQSPRSTRTALGRQGNR